MRSGNGKHRRPRQAPALVVAAGVAGSAIAIPLLGATSATAAEATTWDRVADCESGGMWSADLGNGYYGGLQFSPETWQKFGGTAYAQRADLASRSQQIQVAEKVLAVEGPQAWPSCALISGLTDGDDTAPGDGATAEPTPAESDASEEAEAPAETPDVTEVPEKAASTPADGETAKADAGDGTDGTGEASGATGVSKDSEPGDATTAPTTGTPADSDAADTAKAGKHRGEEAREDADAVSGESGIERESGRHASRGDGSTRDGAGADGAEGADGEYTVRAGDTLWAIADAHDVRGGWQSLYDANEKVVGSDPDLILPGQSLDLN